MLAVLARKEPICFLILEDPTQNLLFETKNNMIQNEPRCEKTGLRGFRPGLTQTELCSHRRWLDA